MALWIPYFSVTLIIWFLSKLRANNVVTLNLNNRSVQKGNTSVLPWILILIVLCVFCAFRSISSSSIDEYAYRNRFRIYQGTSLLEALEISEGEYINGLLAWLSTVIFKTDQGIIITYSIIAVIFYILSIKKYCNGSSYGIALLMAMGVVNTLFNIEQQAIACAIFLYFSDYISEKHLWKYLLLVIVCFFIHNISIILLPLYFIVNKNPSRLRGVIYIAFSLFAIRLFYLAIPFIAKFIPMLSQYTEFVESGHAGVVLITVIINCVPSIFAFLFMDALSDNGKYESICTNMTFIHAGIYLASLGDRYIARLAMFTLPFCVMFLVQVANRFDDKMEKYFFQISSILLYSVELYLRMSGCFYAFNFSL